MPTGTIELDDAPDAAPDEPEDTPRVIVVQRSKGDRIYRGIARGSGLATFAIMGLIGTFLFALALPAFRAQGLELFTTSVWEPERTGEFGVASALLGTVVVSLVAMVIAVPCAIATALYINEYSPRAIRGFLIAMVDLLAAIPSIVYGLWGRDIMQTQLTGLAEFLDGNLGFIPIFKVENGQFNSSRFMAGVVVALMVLPIATSVIRQVFSQTPASEKEAALALGGTRWGMIRSVVLPFGRGGIIGGSMLALGRALGETIAVALILTESFSFDFQILQGGGATIASLIALKFGQAGDIGISALMAAGLVLFLLTLLVNILATVIVNRSRSGSGVEL